MYEVELTFHQGSEREFTWYEKCATLQGGVEWIKRHSAGSGPVQCYIDNVRVIVRDGQVLSESGEPLSSIEKDAAPASPSLTDQFLDALGGPNPLGQLAVFNQLLTSATGKVEA